MTVESATRLAANLLPPEAEAPHPLHGLGKSGMMTVVLLAAVLPFVNSVWNGFALDDVPIVQQNPFVHSLDNGSLILTSPYWPVSGRSLGLYRPLTSLLFAVQWQVGGGAPWVFHLVNVGLHAGASLLLLGMLLVLFRGSSAGPEAALGGALLFAVHPVHTEAVANIVGQSELLAATAVLAACWLHAVRPEGVTVGPARLALLMLLYLLAAAAKEHAIVLPALLVVIDVAQRRVRFARHSLATYAAAMIVPLVGLAVIATFFLAARTVVLGSLLGGDANPALPFLQGGHRIWNAMRAWPEFYRLLLFPLDLSVDYAPGVIPPATGPDTMVLLGGMLLLSTVVLAGYAGRSRVGLAAAWLFITLLPVSNLLFPVGVLVAERTLYLPSVSAALLVATALAKLRSLRDLSGRALLVGAAVLVFMGLRTAVRNPVWQSTASVQASLVSTRPESYRAQWSAAGDALRRHDPVRARQHYLLGYRIYNQDPVFVAEIGNFHIGQGDLAGALKYLREARARYPEFPRAQIYSAYVFNRIGQSDSALAVLAQIPATSPEMTVNYRLIQSERARAFEELGDFGRAAAGWRVLGRDSNSSAWLFRAREARALARGGWHARAKQALFDAHAVAVDDDAREAIDALARMITSGCYASATCASDPLSRWTGA